jgi:hypothetical protein
LSSGSPWTTASPTTCPPLSSSVAERVLRQRPASPTASPMPATCTSVSGRLFHPRHRRGVHPHWWAGPRSTPIVDDNDAGHNLELGTADFRQGQAIHSGPVELPQNEIVMILGEIVGTKRDRERDWRWEGGAEEACWQGGVGGTNRKKQAT